MQQARFNTERERLNSLFFRSYKNDRCVFQFHSQIEIYFVDEGEMEMRVGGCQRLLRAPAVSVSLGFCTHAYRTPLESRSSVLLIPAHLCEEFFMFTRGKRFVEPFITDPEVYSRLRELYDAICSAEGKRIKQLGYIYTFLGVILDELTLTDAPGEMDTDLASRILLYIDENYKSGITPASVAQHFGYSQSYISRYFSASFETTLSKYLTSVKLRNALSLMQDKRHDITYCALESGFASMRTFYRAFHNEFGISPREFIKEVSS